MRLSETRIPLHSLFVAERGCPIALPLPIKLADLELLGGLDGVEGVFGLLDEILILFGKLLELLLLG